MRVLGIELKSSGETAVFKGIKFELYGLNCLGNTIKWMFLRGFHRGNAFKMDLK